jgi:hypothetical protein
MVVVNNGLCLLIPVGLVMLIGAAAATAQTNLPADPTKSVRIFGRLVFPSGQPASFTVRMAEVAPDGLKDDVVAGADGQKGIFTFYGRPATKYRIYISGYKTPPKTVDTASGKDIDVGDLVFENCPPPADHPIARSWRIVTRSNRYTSAKEGSTLSFSIPLHLRRNRTGLIGRRLRRQGLGSDCCSV